MGKQGMAVLAPEAASWSLYRAALNMKKKNRIAVPPLHLKPNNGQPISS